MLNKDRFLEWLNKEWHRHLRFGAENHAYATEAIISEINSGRFDEPIPIDKMKKVWEFQCVGAYGGALEWLARNEDKPDKYITKDGPGFTVFYSVLVPIDEVKS